MDLKASPRGVTLSDIARAIGVSRATVSLVLRDSPLVHQDTRSKVQAELKRQRYVYNRGAANLRQRTSTGVALVINDLSNPFFAEFVTGVDEALGQAGYITLLGSTGESPQRQQAVVASLMEHNPTGLILSPAEGSDLAQLQTVLDGHANVLLFNRELGKASWDFLGLDNAQGAYLATCHLLSLGHRRIAFYGGHPTSSSCTQRRSGYRRALQEAGVAHDVQWMIETDPNRLDAVARCEVLLESPNGFTAAVCYNDNVALGLMLELAARGVRPGRDFSVTGFDDITEAAVTSPPLTTLATRPHACGRQAATLLLQRAADPQLAVRQVIAPVTLQIRASSGAARA